ncbi:DEAD/DEAH box helicase [Jannaschia seohaensis]|uniref:ATP-dependent RNA helicase DeaD n=1 Tax=Jannaschia seohaensis TaxID=475081 RepID=A0A2Y9AU96_9RHOB|nr:ATP-dependent RNA helicase DeaD [Jannaschia seohaensis]SSA47555.1 ATP-dependent RNA helicase DeaD [Jannaschia seohaensis]
MKRILADALAQRGYDTLTPVQQAVTDPTLKTADLLVSAQTGSGKTLGFGLAIAPTLLGEAETWDAPAAPLALIVAPTRELALQVRRELAWLYDGAALAGAVGGMDMRDERRALARGAHVVVATPGRLADHIRRGTIDLSAIRAVVLDEADEMLDLGFREDLEFILAACPAERRTLLFSATVPPAIERLAQTFQRDAQRIQVAAAERQHADITYLAHEVTSGEVEAAVVNVLRYHESTGAIVFCNTRAAVNRLAARLTNRGFPVVALSGELSQAERGHALQAMRDGRARVCVATDVAARGIDLPGLDLVIHAELPTGSDTLLHRSGRTGRAGRKGMAVLIVPPSARRKAHRLLGWAKLSADWTPPPSADAVRARDRDRLLEDPIWWEEEGADPQTVADLTARFTPEQLARTLLKMRAERLTAPEDLTEPAAPRAPSEFGPSRWFELDAGRHKRMDPKRILAIVCKGGGVTRDDVGAIRIAPHASFVQIREDAADSFFAATGGALSDGIRIRPAEAPPQAPKPKGKSKGPQKANKPMKPKPPRPAGGKGPEKRAKHAKPKPTKN